MLHDEIDQMSDKVFEEAERADEAELNAETWQALATDAEDRLEQTLRDLETRGRDIESLKVCFPPITNIADYANNRQTEIDSLHTVSADSTKLLTEKLALARVLVNLQPELEHLRSQASTHQHLLSDKLSLQQQLETTQAELENSNRKLQRAIAKEGKLNEQDAKYETEIEELEKQLAKSKKDQVKAEKKVTVEMLEKVKTLETQLATERKDREAAEKKASANTAESLQALEKQLEREKQAREKALTTTAEKDSEEVVLLRKELAREKKAREKAEKAGTALQDMSELIESLQAQLLQAQAAQANAETLSNAPNVDVEQLQTLRKEIAKEKKARERAENALATRNDNDGELENIREEHIKELAKERKICEQLEKALASQPKQGDDRVDKLESELKNMQTLRAIAEKQLSKSTAEHEAQKAVLDDKLDQFRSKLKSTKEKLREAEKELEEARTQTQIATNVTTKAATKASNPRKRAIAQVAIDPDAAIGTPGDGPGERALKRGKRASSVVGEKSTFSITPFLNRTASVAPEDLPLASIEESDASPTTERTKPSSKQASAGRQALVPASTSKSNSKGANVRRKGAAASSNLEQVAEEESSENEAGVETTVAASILNDENVPPVFMVTADKPTEPSKPKLKLKASYSAALKPKSLASFASFRDSSVPPQFHRQQSLSVAPQQQQRKKRKLIGLTSTIFDENEEDAAIDTVGAAAKGFGGVQRAFGAFGVGRGLGGLSSLGMKKGPIVVAKEDGFMFSPLKRNKRGASAAVE